LRLLLLALSAAAVHAQSPFIYYRGVVNVASYMPPGLPAGSIARGAQFSIFGANLGPATSPALAFPLSTTLAAVSISVAQGTTTVAAIPVFLSPGQINAIMPSNAPLGLVTLRVTYNNFRSNAATVRIVNSSFGIFTSTGTGQGPGSIQNYSTAALPLNALNAPAVIGQTEILYGVGLGPAIGPDNVAPVSANLPTQVEVFVGGVAALISYSGRAACCAGIDQINFQVPAGAPSGCWVPVFVRTEGAIVSNHVTMAIGPNASACSEPNNPLATALLTGGKIASFLAARMSVRHDVNVVSPVEAVTELLGGYVAQEKSNPYNFNPAFSFPPAGSCTVYTNSGLVPFIAPIPPGILPTAGGLDPGSMSISGSSGNIAIQSPLTSFIGMAGANLGGSILQNPVFKGSLFLNPGQINITANGGSNVGSFSTSFTMPSAFTWNNRDTLSTVTRSQGLNVSWSGVPSGHSVFITGGAADFPSNSTTVFLCLAHPGDLSFTVPSAVLANMLPLRQRALQSLGAIYVGEWPLASPNAIQASGLDSGTAMPAQILGKSVNFQ
jgi:uncharacterized protein (TIGR03437 family)